MSERGPHVFISYHRADLAVAEQVRAHLIANQIATWMDQYDIPAGAYWPDEIDKGLGRSDFVIGVLSPDAADSRNVKNEWDWALQNGKHLILLMARPCVIPHRYVSINFIDATGSDQSGWLDMLMLTTGLRPAAPKFRIPQTRYALSNGLSVAWQEFGSGDIDLVYIPGFVSNVEYSWTHPALRDHLIRWGTLGRILKFDKRGTGLSDRAFGVPAPEERMDDVRAVMDAAGSERAVMYGLSQGVPLAIMFAATYPERTRGLILYGGSATYVRRPDYPWQKSLEEWKALIAEEEESFPQRWGTTEFARESLHHYAPSAVDDESLVEWTAGFMRSGATPGAAVALDCMDLEVDVRSILPSIQVPTLVIHRISEIDADIGEARYIAARVPGAVLKELPGNDHYPFVGDQDAFFAPIGEFLETLKRPAAAPERIQIPQTRYALSNGLSIAWQEFGSGPSDLVFVPGFFSHLELTWKNPRLARFLTRFGEFARVIKFDKRGTGMSDRSAGIPTMDERIDDISAVMDAAGVARAILYGVGEGVSLAVLFAARFPERTQALILYSGSASYVRQADYPWQKTRDEWEAEIAERERTLPQIWGTLDYARSIVSRSAPSLVDDDALADWLAEFLRLSASPGAAIAQERRYLDIDVRSVLPNIRVPTLVMYRADNRSVDPGEARYVADRIPGAILRAVPGEDQIPWAGDQEPYFRAIYQFVATLGHGDSDDSVLATVVRVRFGSALPAAAVVNDALNRFRGTVAQRDDTGVTATFDSPVRAIRFAGAMIAQAGAERGSHAGVHIGEVHVAGESISGTPVEIATRLAEVATPGQILATGTVRDLVAGSGIGFHEASPAQADGIPYGLTVLIVDSESIDQP
jgi:pimeloyl-ACP methyl ester carboxylesterase